MRSFFEFFAGGGMVRAGLGKDWTCRFANDFDRKKCDAYRQNWGDAELKLADINLLGVDDLPRTPHLVWASFPCQDLSLAGGGAGLKGNRSGTFWPFWDLMQGLLEQGPAPNFIVLENVCGTLTSHEGRDFEAIVRKYVEQGYRVGAMVIDAELFVPQSRPRLFFIGIPNGNHLPDAANNDGPQEQWHPAPLKRAYLRLPSDLKDSWLWWHMPKPPKRKKSFADLVEDDPEGVEWHSALETRRLLAMMAPAHKKQVDQAKIAKSRMVGTIYRRTRPDENGNRVQRAEVRFDNVAGCLRTPAGGSSRQVILVVEGKSVRSRLISARETARLMGLSDDYVLPPRYNEAYHLTGDGVVVDVVRHLSDCIFVPALDALKGRVTVKRRLAA